MEATKHCQNSHLIRTSEWKLRICAISTLPTSPSFSTPSTSLPVLCYPADPQTGQAPSFQHPCPAALPAPALNGAIDSKPWFALASGSALKKTPAFPQCISRNSAFQEGHRAPGLEVQQNPEHLASSPACSSSGLLGMKSHRFPKAGITFSVLWGQRLTAADLQPRLCTTCWPAQGLL